MALSAVLVLRRRRFRAVRHVRFAIGVAVLLVPAGANAQVGASAQRTNAPAAVVQRFVDAANARDAEAMAALVTADAEFARFPDGTIIARDRAGVRDHYARLLRALTPEFRIIVQARIVEGQLVIDQERFTGMPGDRRQATWMYLVRDSLIHRAWVLDGQRGAAGRP